MSDPSPRPLSRKPIFDLVRKFMGRKFRQSEVERLDDALDASLESAGTT
jgi:hypothetical protein